MAYGNYNNDKPNVNVYSSIMFSNPDSPIAQTRFSISYFNRLMCISIAQKNPTMSAAYPTYNNDSAAKVYLSYSHAKMLHDSAVEMFKENSKEKSNVCVETRNGIIKISNGVEFGSPTPCISIISLGSGGTNQEYIYQTKDNFECTCNYFDNKFDKKKFPLMEIDTFIMALEEYYKASSYAIVASITESNAFKEKAKNDLLRSIADKVGVNMNSYSSYGNNRGYSNRSYFNNNTNNNTSSPMDNNTPMSIPDQYSSQSFDDLVSSMSIPPDDDAE